MTERRFQPLWYGDAFQIFAAAEHPVPDARHAIGYYNTAAIAGIFLQHAGFNNKVVGTVCLRCCLVKPFPGDGFDISADLTEAA